MREAEGLTVVESDQLFGNILVMGQSCVFQIPGSIPFRRQ